MLDRATLTPAEATTHLMAAGMSISVKTLRDGIEQGVFPFGICVMSDSRIFYISKNINNRSTRSVTAWSGCFYEL